MPPKPTGTPDATVNATSTPALFASAQTVNDLDIKTGTSLANSGNNTVFVGHNGGTTAFQENRATLASSSVKYYTKDYIGEEMVGDIRGMWPLTSVNDASLKGYNLTNNNSVTFTTSGVHGVAPIFNGTNQSLTYSSYSMGATNFSWGGWFKWTTTPTSSQDVFGMSMGVSGTGSWAWVFGMGGLSVNVNGSTATADSTKASCGAGSGSTNYQAQSTTTMTSGNWYHIVCTLDSNGLKAYINGSLGATNTAITTTGQTFGLFAIARDANGASRYWAGTADEIFTTSIILTTTQIQQLYVSGLEAKITNTVLNWPRIRSISWPEGSMWSREWRPVTNIYLQAQILLAPMTGYYPERCCGVMSPTKSMMSQRQIR